MPVPETAIPIARLAVDEIPATAVEPFVVLPAVTTAVALFVTRSVFDVVVVGRPATGA
jgi:hypothetical protein